MAKQSSARKMRKQYCQLLPLLQGVVKFMQRILEDLPRHELQLDANIKQYKRTVEKANEEHIKDLRDLSDLARGRLFFSDNFTHEEVVALLKKLFQDKITIKKIDDKREKGHGLEYKGVTHMDLQIGDINFELQIIPIEFKPYKPLLHKIYEELRSNPKMDDKRKKFLMEVNDKIYTKLDRMSKKNRDEAP
jgi:hypothetical protein